MAVVEVDLIDAKTFERPRTRLTDVFWVIAHLAGAVWCRGIREFGSEEDLVALPGLLEPFADEVFAVTVYV